MSLYAAEVGDGIGRGSADVYVSAVGDVKVVLDGRTATTPRAGYYFPEMVMDTTFSPGVTNGVMTIRDANGEVTIVELITAVNAALNGC